MTARAAPYLRARGVAVPAYCRLSPRFLPYRRRPTFYEHALPADSLPLPADHYRVFFISLMLLPLHTEHSYRQPLYYTRWYFSLYALHYLNTYYMATLPPFPCHRQYLVAAIMDILYHRYFIHTVVAVRIWTVRGMQMDTLCGTLVRAKGFCALPRVMQRGAP